MTKNTMTSLALAALTLLPSPAFPAAINGVAAVIGDELVTFYEAIKEAQPAIRELERKGTVDAAVRTQQRKLALERLIERRLVSQKVKELNIRVSEEEISQAVEDIKKQNKMSQETLVAALSTQGIAMDDYREQLREQIERLKLVNSEVRARIQVGETEMKEFYEANQAKFTEEESFRARHIFFRINDKAPADTIKMSMTNALMVLTEAKSGKDFIELAKTYSEDPAARSNGGDLGIFRRGEMLSDLEQAVSSLKPGDVSELIYTPSGFHIVKLEERIPGKLKPFESVKTEIEETIFRKKTEERFSQWAKELRSKAAIDLKDPQGIL